MRIYIPATLSRLAAIVASGGTAAGLVAYAVTPALREWYVDDDVEELEYAAMADAARDSLRQLAADRTTDRAADRTTDRAGAGPVPARRVVVAADVPDAMARPLAAPIGGGSKAAVRLAARVPMSAVASVHVDADEAIADVQAGIEAVAAADAGDDDAQFIVDGVEDHELLWYATQEIPDLLGWGPAPTT